jgi:hypothetical protein
MSILWTAPAALIGLALIVLPIAVHLLARQHVRTLAYPSLRFLRQTQLASFRRRRIEDALLLACRVGIVAVAAAALAGPILETPSRIAGYANRTARAIVTSEAVLPEAIAPIEEGAFRSTRLQRATIPDALADAVRWLDQQPRSAREIVIAGPLRRGSIEAADLTMVPPSIGIRFAPTAATDGPGDLRLSILMRRNGELIRRERMVHLSPDATRVTDGAASPVAANLVTIRARPGDAALADAALRAALDAGVPWRDFERPVVLVLGGGDESGIAAGSEIVRLPVPVPASAAAHAVSAALTTIGRPDWVEPLTIPRTQLDAWSRRPGPPDVNAPIGDESDRRWLWALALMLLGVEWWLRRSRADRSTAIETDQGARVA